MITSGACAYDYKRSVYVSSQTDRGTRLRPRGGVDRDQGCASPWMGRQVPRLHFQNELFYLIKDISCFAT